SSVPLQKEVKHPQKRLQHLAGRNVLKVISPHFPIEEIKINHQGRPYLPNDTYHFSITHIGKYAAAIVSTECPVGIDIEKISSRIHRLAPRFLSVEEMKKIDKNDLNYTLCWSTKEAIYKWYQKKDTQFRKHISILSPLSTEDNPFNAVLNCNGYQKKLEVHF